MACLNWRCINIFVNSHMQICISKRPTPLFRSSKRLFFFSPVVKEVKGVDLIQNDNEVAHSDEEDLLKAKQNKSGLKTKHYRQIHKMEPSLTEDEKNIMPLWQYRKLFGRYGEASNINLKALWPSSEEMEREKEREYLEFPFTVREMISKAKREKEDQELEIMARQNQIKENMKNLAKWMKEVRDRKTKYENEALLSLEKKRQQIEEVRQIFGYSISPHDERFQEALDKKIEEDKKRMKKEKKLIKQQQLLEKLKADAELQRNDQLLGKPIVESQEPLR